MGRGRRQQVQEPDPDGKMRFPLPKTFTIGEAESPPWQNYRTAPSSQWQNGQTRSIASDAIDDMVERCKRAGFDKNAIVCLRHKPGEAWRRTSHMQWGVVEFLINTAPANGETYKPLMVRWFVPNAHQGIVSEKCYMDDLYLIHAHLDDTLLDQIFEQQDDE